MNVKATYLDTYSHALEEASDKSLLRFIGPRAIFDTNFLPPVFFPRKKLALTCQSLLSDALIDQYSTNIAVYGLKGTGKNLMISHFVSWSLNQFRKDACPFLVIRIDCAQKEIDQIFFEIMTELGSYLHIEFRLEQIQTYTSSLLWNAVKLLVEKCPIPIVLFFQAADSLDPNLLTKFCAFAKEMQRVQIIISVNTGMQIKALRNYSGIDHRIQMDLYSMHELQEIIQQRAIMTVPKTLLRSSLDLVVDLAAEFDVQTPGACMNLFRACYPQILQTDDLTPEMLRLATQYQYEGVDMDRMSMTEFVINTSFEDRCFLEYLVDFFRDRSKYYITFEEIKKMYKMTCEELSIAPTKEEFFASLAKITNSQILRPSLLHITPKTQKINGVYPVPYYLTVPIDEINEVIDVSFGMYEKESL